MKINHLLAILVFGLGFTSLFAQSQTNDSKKPVKVNKQLKQVMKELPADLQVQVLRFAEQQQSKYQAAQIKRAEMKASPAKVLPRSSTAVKAKPAPKPEKMATPAPQKAQEIKLANPQGAKAAPAEEAKVVAPPKPDYLRIAESMEQTRVEWLEDDFDFGKVKEGEKPSHVYKFRNTGTQPLKITRVKPSCGCTSPNWSKEEIAPGEEGFIEVSYNSKNRPGPARKSITVTGNFEERNKTLRFKVDVIKAE